jgi:hypothetical protein
MRAAPSRTASRMRAESRCAALALLCAALVLPAAGAAADANTAPSHPDPSAASGPAGWAADDISGGAALDGVSCASSAFCVAIDAAGAAHRWDGKTWSGADQLASSFLQPNLLSVSCASATFCLAGGLGGQVWRWDGSTWSGPTTVGGFLPLPIHGLSCPSAIFCVAVDDLGRAFSWDGSGWSSGTQVTVQPPSNVGGGAPLSAVSCASASLCVAVDETGDAYTFDGSGWSAATNIAGADGLGAVSCPASSSCVVVSDAGDAYTWNGAAWSSAVPVSPGFVLAGVSCTGGGAEGAVARCLAVDARGAAYAASIAADGSSAWRPVGGVDKVPAAAVSCIASRQCAYVERDGRVREQRLPAGAVKAKPVPAPPDPGIAYAQPVIYTLADRPTAVASGRFGKARGLAVALQGGQLAVLLEDGQGGYRQPVYYPLPEAAAYDVVAADLRGTGRDDLAVVMIGSDAETPEVAVLASRPNGSFAAPVTYGLEGFRAGQGHTPTLTAFPSPQGRPPSLLVGNPGNAMPLLVNNGDGTFTSTQVLPLPTRLSFGENMFAPYRAAIGDLSGTGPLDIAAPSTLSGLALAGNVADTGAGFYRESTLSKSVPLGGLSRYSTQAALNVPLGPKGTGLVGLALRTGGGLVRVSLYWVGAQGAMAPVQALTSHLGYFQAAAVGFFGREHRPGVVAADFLGGDLAVFGSDGKRLLSPVYVPLVASGFQPFQLTAINRPGHPSDLAVVGGDFGTPGGTLAVLHAAAKP